MTTQDPKALAPLEPVVSLKWDESPDGTFFVQMTVSGLPTERQAQFAMDHVRRLFCAQEMEASS